MTGLRLAEAWQIARRTGLTGAGLIALLSGYYSLTLLSALCDGLGLVLLVSLVTGKLGDGQPDTVTAFLLGALNHFGIDGTQPAALLIVAILFGIKTIILFGLSVADARFTATIRQKLQESAYTAAVSADWEVMRGKRIGQLVGQLTEETHLVTRYMVSAIKAVYYVIASLIFGFLALVVSVQLTLLMALVALPLVYGLRRTMSYQSRVSALQTDARQGFAADMAERLNNLFFIKTQGSEARHIATGNRHQPEIARLEVLIGWCQALIANFNAILILLALGGFYLWTIYSGQPLQDALHLLASVGTVGARAAAQFNNAVGAVGNVSRFSGSIPLLDAMLALKPSRPRQPMPERVVLVELSGACYVVDGRPLTPMVTTTIGVARPIAIRGPSGTGKTTTANLISGVYQPSSGTISYIGVSGVPYDATNYRAKIGYVTQDIFLFHGTVRDNLILDENTTDAILQEAINLAGAGEFIARIGGLDASIAEAGRSLSGGEKRRLGIARALATSPDILILDEITSGLDPDLRAEIVGLIDHLAERVVIVAISHETGEFASWTILDTSWQHV